MTPRPSLMFYCQHSLGMGHLVRSLAVARALARSFTVTFLSGGALPPGIGGDLDAQVIQLPPVGMDETGHIISRDGNRSIDDAFEERRRVLLAAYRQTAPEAVILELFPFGRRRFSGELLPLLEQVRRSPHPRPILLSSVRDILVSRGAGQREHDARAAAVLAAYFDGVVVHSDPQLATLEESLAPEVDVPVPVFYTGFVHEPVSQGCVPQTEPGSIIVSAGGGRVGAALLGAVLDAYPLLPSPERRPLELLAGPFIPDDLWADLCARAERLPGVHPRRSVPCLAAELQHAAGSISQCGYNTAMDLLSTRVPALVVPYGEGSEDEQLRRARRLESLGALRVLPPAEVSPDRIALEMSALLSFVPAATSFDLGGASNTASIVRRLVQDRPAPHGRPQGSRGREAAL